MKVAAGAAWLVSARLIVNLLGLVSTVVLARVLTPDDFGLVALGTSLLVIVNAFTDQSLESALVQLDEPTVAHYSTAWTLGVLRGVAVGTLFALAALPAAAVFAEPRLRNVMLALACSIVIAGLMNPRAVMMTKQLVFWQQFMLECSQKAIGLVVSLSTALIYRSYWALIAGAIVGKLSGVILSYTVLPFRPKFRLSRSREILTFTMWLTGGRFINTLNWRIDHLLIGAVVGRPALGYYTVGDNLAMMPTREIMTPLARALFPAFTHVRDSRERLTTAYQRVQVLTTALVLPVGVGTALVADPLVMLVMGRNWAPSVLVIQVLASIFALQTLGSLAQPVAMAINGTKLLFIRDLQGVVVRIPLIVAGLAIAGLPGIVYARAASGFVGTALNMYIVKHVTGLRLVSQFAANGRSILSVTAMTAAVLGSALISERALGDENHVLELVIKVIAGAATYTTVHIALWRWNVLESDPESDAITTLARFRWRAQFASWLARTRHS